MAKRDDWHTALAGFKEAQADIKATDAPIHTLASLVGSPEMRRALSLGSPP